MAENDGEFVRTCLDGGIVFWCEAKELKACVCVCIYD